ncbi:hypothetical protein [uncultured Chitinophaga sp.]|uniref:hypothetical protein n=1 Tax=uncultured Chitinophaga sp. TaxID=339340 RepID=UPI0025D5F2D3|nr:hypothetical protein [uncultured Chitinophaga sp.]
MVTLSTFPLFESLLSLNSGTRLIDIRNDYVCEGIAFNAAHKEMRMFFIGPKRVSLDFQDAIISKFDLSFKPGQKLGVLDTFYRGRFTDKSGLVELDKKGRGFYCLDFADKGNMEVFAKEVYLNL